MKLNKIKKGTDNCVFDWILESERNGSNSIDNSFMIRALIKKHNELIDYISILEKNFIPNEPKVVRNNELTDIECKYKLSCGHWPCALDECPEYEKA